MTTTMHPGWLHTALHSKVGTALAALALAGLIAGGALLFQDAQRRQSAIPDEKAAAVALLAQKLSGPRYFQSAVPPSDQRVTHVPDSRNGEPVISVADALAQMDRIVAERHLDAARAVKIRQLIDRLAEPPDSRMVGEASVNLLRLNLALDELR
jgi:potassium-transporting ATPase KdpC subunit